MKRVILGIGLCLMVLGVGHVAKAADEGMNNRFELSANPLGILIGSYNLQAFYALPETRKHAIGVHAGYFDYNLILLNISGLTVGPGWRYFFGEEGMGGHGAVFGAKVPLGLYTIGTVDITRVPIMTEILYRWNWGGFTLALGGGIGYAYTSLSGTPTETLAGFTDSGVAWDLTFTLGYAF
jgi:hypothetical protein